MSYNLGSNCARNFKSALHLVLVWFWNYSRDNSLNCTPLGSVTITNWKNCQIGSQQHKHTLTLPKNKRNRYSNSKNFIPSHNYCLLINFLQNPHIDCHRKKLLPYHEEWELPEKQRGCVSDSFGCKDQLRAGNYIFGAHAIWTSKNQIELAWIRFQASNTTLPPPR